MSKIVMQLPHGISTPKSQKFFEGLKTYLDLTLPPEWKIAILCLEPDEAYTGYKVFSFSNMGLELRAAAVGRWNAGLKGENRVSSLHHWIENEAGEIVPATQKEWVAFTCSHNHFLVSSVVGTFRVSTIFMGIELAEGPLLYSTGVLNIRSEPPRLVREWTYDTRAKALENHQRVVLTLENHQTLKDL